ncbi:hypothetical protein DFJ69_5441 [Thermomonospora umbrina]|uniref:Uncharacterized protein n=2 Tax=Thermomonospora umbrina TaxID=111806 RepID=A0A3D9T0R7_9ACTN|nr:hypothetical protein DFJ69_5441 [Thermomonospora umbrina]
MAGGFISKIFGGEQKQELDSCCGSVNVVPEDEETPNEVVAQKPVEEKPSETMARADH